MSGENEQPEQEALGAGGDQSPSEEGAIFNTQAVERLTGVPADTFRAWERRYGVPLPRRLPGGRRAYSARDVEVVRWLRQQTENGVAVSLAASQIQHGGSPPREVLPATLSPAALARNTVAAVLRFDTKAVEQTLSHALAAHPFDVVCLDVVQPALVEIGELWHRGEITPAVEHFGSHLLRRRLEQLAAILDAGAGRPLVVVGAAPGELHDVGALIFSMLLRRRGIYVVYLGANVPLDAAQDVARRLRPDMICLSAATRETAAALAETARSLGLLGESAPLIAFGGRAFEEAPALIETVPGLYLGHDAREAAVEAERLLRSALVEQPTKHSAPC